MRYSENKVVHAKFLEGGAVISKTEKYFEAPFEVQVGLDSQKNEVGVRRGVMRSRNEERSDEELGPSTGERREERGKGSKKEVRKDLNDDIEQRGKWSTREVTKDLTAGTEERVEDSRREVTKDLGVDMVGDETEEKIVREGTTTEPLVSSETIFQDVPGYVYELMKEGYSYGVHLRRHIVRVRQYRFTTRVRCMRHKKFPKGTGCKAGIVAKLCTDMRGWVVTGEKSHNHKRYSMSKKAIGMRVSAIRNSIKNCCPKTLHITYFQYTPKNAHRAEHLEVQKSGLQEILQSQTAKTKEVTIIIDSDEDFMSFTPRPPDLLLTPHRTAPRILDLDSSGRTDERKEVQDVTEVDEETFDEGRASEDTGDCFLGDVVQSILTTVAPHYVYV
ncbi:hypothetical protein FGB62_22g98 [Gracilaria domingensis]|nr:hypothetical protein FGB62_22g98 [Gracilaria domingensis]